MDDLKKKLLLDEVSFRSASQMYDHVIQNNKSSQSPDSEYMKALIIHQDGLVALADHALEKSKSTKCLSCEEVMSCQKKCDSFKL